MSDAPPPRGPERFRSSVLRFVARRLDGLAHRLEDLAARAARAGGWSRGTDPDAFLSGRDAEPAVHAAAAGEAAGSRGTSARASASREAGGARETRLRQLRSLGEAVCAVTGSLDLDVALEAVLERCMEDLGADAAAVLLLEEPGGVLTFASSRGFRTAALRRTRLEPGESHAGRAALRRETVRVDDLRVRPGGLGRSLRLDDEGFVTYHGVPLVARGELVGVLELFHRRRFRPGAPWRELADVLAAQAAVALHDARLVGDLRREHAQLRQAYDQTIVGWSRAMELRDPAMRGHAERVATMSVHLGRGMGLDREALADLWRGAVLHDIGKIVLPDRILQGEGPLDNEEWNLIRRHPVIAYELLVSIDFLRPALEAAYHHHERMDGSGYPRGIAGEEIPLPARILAVVDVWDALRSERSYRSAWPPEKVRRYLRTMSGTHFDPRAVREFLALLRRESPERLLARKHGLDHLTALHAPAAGASGS